MDLGHSIKVGILRCDTHAAWYGTLMAGHDPLRLRQPLTDPAMAEETWQAGGVHYFHYSHYADPARMTAAFFGGFEICKVWDARPGVAESFAALFDRRPVVCAAPADVSDGVDLVFIADCNGDGADHRMLAEPGLEKGVPTFVDKPFSRSLDEALAIEECAKRSQTPILSLSLLQCGSLISAFRSRIPEIGRIDSGVITGYSLHPAALIHSLCAAQAIFGSGIKSVRVSEEFGWPLVHLSYDGLDGRPSRGVLIRCGEADYRWSVFYASAHGSEGAIQSAIYSDFRSDGVTAVLEAIVRMVRHREVSPLHREMLRAVSVMDSVSRAKRSGKTESVIAID